MYSLCGKRNWKHSDLLGAIIEQGSDPVTIETEEDARKWANTLNEASEIRCHIDKDAIKEIRCRLSIIDIVRVNTVYTFMAGSGGSFVLYENWYI